MAPFGQAELLLSLRINAKQIAATRLSAAPGGLSKSAGFVLCCSPRVSSLGGIQSLCAMTKSLIPEKVQWSILASLAVTTSALMLFVRWSYMCPFLESSPFAFLSFSGLVNGRDPYLFTRVMQNLTHPLFLLGYTIVVTFVVVRSFGTPLSARSGRFIFVGLALIHLIFIVSYIIAMFLPVGDPVAVIST